MRLGALSTFAAKGHDPTPVPPPNTFEQTMLGIPDLLALWTCGEDGGTVLNDSVGTRHATITGTPTFNQPDLAANSSIGAINFGGVSSAAVPHDSGLELAAFGVHLRFTIHAIPVDGEPSAPIWSKEGTGLGDGDTTIFVDDTGFLNIQMQTAAASFSLTSQIEAGVPYSLTIGADNTGFEAFLLGRYLGKNTNVTAAWSTNTRPIEFASSPPFTADGNVTLQYVGIYSRKPTEAEALTLAQKSSAGLPAVTDDDVSVPESAVTAIAIQDLLANDDFVGIPAFTLVTQPSPDSAAASGDQLDDQVNYTAGAVSADTLREFQYRISNLFGTSQPGRVRVTVRNAGAPPAVSNANPFTFNTNDVVDIGSGSGDIFAALQAALAAAPPGRTVRINPGNYTGGTGTLNPNGTLANPIVVRPNGARGSVTINAPTWTTPSTSASLILCNLYFTNPRIAMNGIHHRVTRCRIRNVTRGCFPLSACREFRFDHMDVSDYVNSSADKTLVSADSENVSNETFKNLLYDYNYIHDITHTFTPDPRTAFFFSTASASASSKNPGVIYDHCLFRNNNIAGHGEFIVMKHSGYKVRFCTLDNNDGYVEQRSGGGWEVRSNWLEGGPSNAIIMIDWFDGRNAAGTDEPLLIGNRVVNADIWICNGATVNADGPWEPSGNRFRCREGQIIGNIARTIFVGRNFASLADNWPALDNNLFGNTATITNEHQVGTTFNDPGADPRYDFVPATKMGAVVLAAGDPAGMFAPDPLCPDGPQS